MGFYNTMLAKWQEHLRDKKPIASFFVGSSENLEKMRTTYQTLGSIERFTNYLEEKAAAETAQEAGLTSSTMSSLFIRSTGRGGGYGI